MNLRLRSMASPEAAVVLGAIVLRVWMLDLKPPHFDEGVNGWFADQMVRTGCYRYDPTNYHGPLHFYALFVSQSLFGRNLWALRLPAVIASVLSVWMALRFRDWLGRTVSLIAGAAMAVSPAFVFYGRYSIHESWQVLFLLIAFWGLLGLWLSGKRRCLHALAGGITGLVLSKETYVIHLGCMALAAPCLWLWERISPSAPAEPAARREWSWADAWATAGLGVAVIVFFYSGTFLNWAGVLGLFKTFAAWFATGMDAGGHQKPGFAIGLVNFYWLALMARYEWPAAAGVAACFRYLLPSSRLLRYIAIYGVGAVIAYSIIPYKTPWCVISLLWPFYFTLADSLAAIRQRIAATTVAALVFAQSLFACARLNFARFADPHEPYVYVQTFPEIDRFTRPILDLARRDPRAYHARGRILLDSYYPLPWILGDFTDIGYYKTGAWPDHLDADFIAVEAARSSDVESRLKSEYFRRSFRLRDAQADCVAYFNAETFRGVLEGEPEVRCSVPR